MFIPLLLLACLSASSLWTGIMNTLHREHQARTTYFSHSSLIKYIKSRTEADEIVFRCILAVKPQQIANNCKLLFSLSCCFFQFQKGGTVNSHIWGLIVKTERTRKGEDHGHPQKHTHRIKRTKLDNSEERSIFCCSIYASVLKSNMSELFLRKKFIIIYKNQHQ